MKLKNKRIIPALLISSIIVTNASISYGFAYDKADTIKNFTNNCTAFALKETSNGIILEYQQIENDMNVYFYEEVENNIVYTKKYIDENGKLKLIEELTTTLKTEKNSDGSEIVKAEINNITNNTTIENVVIDASIDQDTLEPRAIEYHPTDKNYFFTTGISSNALFSALTKAAVVGILTTCIGGGITVNKTATSVLSSIATLVVNGNLSNLYYTTKNYKPIKAAGQPVLKKVTTYYYDKKRTKQCGNRVYTSSSIYNPL